MEKILYVTFLVSTLVTAFYLLPEAWARNEEPLDTLRTLLSDPETWVIFLIQGALGFGLGYFSVKALKYIIAIIAILACGVLLNVWHFGGVDEFLRTIGMDHEVLLSVFNWLVSVIGVLTILPIGIGFFLGAVAAIVK